MSEKVLPGGHWRAVPGRFRMQAHRSGSVLVYVCVLNGHCSCADKNATALRNPGTCHRNFFQGVTGGRFQESSRSEHLHAVNMNTMHKQEMSENVLPGGPWRMVPAMFKMRALTAPCECEQHRRNVRERSSRGSLEVGSGKLQNASAYPKL